MVVYAGPLWHGEPEAETWVRTDGARITDRGTGTPNGPAVPAVLLERVVDYHSHIGDALLQGRAYSKDLAALVAPARGLKHRLLKEAVPEQQEAAMVAHGRRMAAAGTTDMLDFREQGLPGLQMARRVAREVPEVSFRLLGRPDPFPWAAPTDLDGVVGAADGLGIPSLTDWGAERCADLAAAAHRADKPVALHASEAHHEPIEEILALHPDLLVHLCKAERADLRLLAEEGIPVAVCPTSNHHFDLRPPVAELEAMGVPWFLGTDNAMLGPAGLFAEVRQLRILEPTLPDAAILRALTTAPEESLNRFASRPIVPRAPRALVAMPRRPDGTVEWAAEPKRLEA